MADYKETVSLAKEAWKTWATVRIIFIHPNTAMQKGANYGKCATGFLCCLDDRYQNQISGCVCIACFGLMISCQQPPNGN